MERTAVVEQNHQCSDSKLVSKSMESSIKIDSISIDLISPNENSGAEICDHFSIRGYVSEIRKKDWKLCWPFASDGNGNKYDEEACGLPSLHVPKFRYWRCQKCLREVSAKGIGNDYGPILKPCIGGSKSNNASITDDVAMLVSDFQQAPKMSILNEKKLGSNIPENLNNSGDYTLSQFGKIEKKSEVAHGPTRGQYIESDVNFNQETCRLTTEISVQMRKTYSTDDTGDLKNKSNGSVDLFKKGHGHYGASDADLARNLNCLDKSSNKIHEIGEVTGVVDQHKEITACGMSGEAGNIEACGVDKGNGHPSLELDECDRGSSESAEVMEASNAKDNDNSSVLHRRKTRKVRLLTELLCKNGGGDADSIRNDASLSNAVNDASAEGDKLPVPQGQVAIQGNSRRGLGQNRKRKSDQDEDWRPTQTGSPNKAGKEVQVLKRDVESTDAIAKAFAKLRLQTGRKNHCIKRKIDRSLSVSKKKNKKSLVFDESSSLVPVGENLPNKIGSKTGDVPNSNAADGVLIKAMHNAIAGCGTNIFHLPAQRMDKKPSFKKKLKMPQVDNQQVSLTQNHSTMREDPMSRREVEFLHARPLRVQFHTTHDASTENGLNLSLNSYVNTQRYEMQHRPQLEGGRTCLLTWQESTVGQDHVNMKAADTKYLGNFNFNSKSTLDMALGKGVYTDLSGKGTPIRMASLNEKQNYSSLIDIGSCSYMQQKNFCSTSGKKKAIGIQEHSAVTKKDSDQRANKVSEQVSSDDIPMEIVELMAKNQYERCLPDAEYDRCQLEVPDNANSSRSMDFYSGYRNGEMRLFQQENTQQRISSAKGIDGITNRGDNVGPPQLKLVDYFSQSDLNQFNMSQLKHTPTTARFGPFFQNQEKPLSGIQHYASSSGRQQNSAQNCKWVGDLVGKRSSHSCLQISGTCNTCQGIPQQSKEANHLWTSMTPNQVPFIYSIPQKSSALPTGADVLSNSPRCMNRENANGHRDLKYLNQNAANFGKQNRNFSSNSDILRTCADPLASKHNRIDLTQKPMGSLDLYSNETIPAMHLLSLMDAGLQSGANLDGTPKFLKRPTVTQNQDPKEFSRLDSGAYKVSNTTRHMQRDYYGRNPVVENVQRDHYGPNPVAENSHGRTSAPPMVVGSSSISSFPHDKRFKKAADFTNQVSQEKGKAKGSDSQTHIYRSQKSTSPSGNFGTSCGSVPVHSMQTMFFGASNSMTFPLQFHGLENSIKQKLEVPSGARPMHPHKSSSDGICSVNRNPADFSIPGPGNLYMISGEDLKFRKVVPSANGYGSARMGQKRQKKLPTVKGFQRQVII